MKNLFYFFNVLSSVLTAVLIVSPFIFQLFPAMELSIPALYAYIIIAIISWILTLCCIDVMVQKGIE
jgi:hypothetical protein